MLLCVLRADRRPRLSGSFAPCDKNITPPSLWCSSFVLKLVERRFRLTANAADELLTIPERFIHLRDIPHHTFHAAACLRSLFCSSRNGRLRFRLTPSCISRRVTLIFANSCAAVSRLANWTFPMFASTVSWFRLLPMAFCCRRTSFKPSRITIRFRDNKRHIVALAHMRLCRAFSAYRF